MTTIATLPAAPNKATDSAASFSSKADAFVEALDGFVTQANAVAGEVNDAAAAAASDADDAAAAAATALAAPGTNATSTSSMTPATGAKSFTLAEADKDFVVGMAVMVAETADPAGNWMHGIITAFTPATGAITVEVDLICGTPAVAAAWTVSISGPYVGGLGVDQSWDPAGISSGVVYQNTTGKPIEITLTVGNMSVTAGAVSFLVGTADPPTIILASFSYPSTTTLSRNSFSATIPHGWYYKLSKDSGNFNIFAGGRLS
jgi:hypothetical protein